MRTLDYIQLVIIEMQVISSHGERQILAHPPHFKMPSNLVMLRNQHRVGCLCCQPVARIFRFFVDDAVPMVPYVRLHLV